MPEAKTTNFIKHVLPALLMLVIGNSHAQADDAWIAQQLAIESIKDELMSPRFSSAERCAVLSALSDENLITFYDHIEGVTPISVLGCKPALADRLKRYFEFKREVLESTYRIVGRQKLSRCSDRKSDTFGPATDYFIDPKKGGLISGVGLPKCAIAFTFDDGPHPTLTRKLLTALENEKLLVHFFVLGERANYKPEVLREEHAAGHLIGNHSMTHPDLRKLPFKDATAEIESGFTTIINIIGEYLPFFRFPYGAHTKDLQAYLTHFSRVEFFWNIDTLDWKIKDPEKLFEYVLEQIELEQRGIILMHDVHPQTITVAPYLFAALREAGYTPYIIRPTNENPAHNVH